MADQNDTHAWKQGEGGLQRLIEEISALAAQAEPGRGGTERFVLRISEDYAHIRLQDLWRPLRFLRQAASAPPVQVGTEGFRPDLVDDYNPARHYMALLFIGFWLPRPLDWLTLYAWEVAGFIRYRGHWSQPDVRCGLIGIRHGRLVRRYGPTVLPGLMAAELSATPAQTG